MAIECYAMVQLPKPLNEEEKEWNARAKRLEGHDYPEMVQVAPKSLYHFCHCKLVQPSGRGKSTPSGPLPKWEVVKSFLSIEERAYTHRIHAQFSVHRLDEFVAPADFYDAYGDSVIIAQYEYDDESCTTGEEVKFVYVPDYKEEWRLFFKATKTSPRKLRKDVRALPYKHAICDRRIQLRQIRFLFPDTRTMPLNIALDWVRDRM